MDIESNLTLDKEALADLCRRWHIEELALFGSVTRPDFRNDSDVDVMVEFEVNARVGLWDLARLQRELAELIGRDVDLVEKGTILNPYRRAAIERDLTVVYAA